MRLSQSKSFWNTFHLCYLQQTLLILTLSWRGRRLTDRSQIVTVATLLVMSMTSALCNSKSWRARALFSAWRQPCRRASARHCWKAARKRTPSWSVSRTHMIRHEKVTITAIVEHLCVTEILLQVLDYGCVKNLLSNTKTLRQIMEEAMSLLKMFWRAALPSTDSSVQSLKKVRRTPHHITWTQCAN